MWGLGTHQVWGVGGEIWRLVERAWQIVPSGAVTRLDAVWGLAEDGLWAVGVHGLVMRSQGSWSTPVSISTNSLNGITGTDSSHIWAVGDAGFVTFYNGSQWTPEDFVWTSSNLNDVWAFAADDVWACGDGMFHNNGGGWESYTLSQLAITFRDLWGIDGQAWAVGDEGTIFHYAGDWQKQDSSVTVDLEAVWASSSNNAWAIGNEDGAMVVIHYDGNQWSEVDRLILRPDGTSDQVILARCASLWGATGDDVWAACTYNYSGDDCTAVFHLQ